MVFVPFNSRKLLRGRTSAFGLLNRPLSNVRKDIANLLGEIRSEREKANRSPLRGIPLNKLRNKFFNALCIDVATQPLEVVSKTTISDGDKRPLRKLREVIRNPVWEVAPYDAFYRSKKVCSLATDVALFGSKANISHCLERLSIHIWTMPRRHFLGLIRKIRSIVFQTRKLVSPGKAPEALEGFEALTRKPSSTRDHRYARYRKCRHIDGFSRLRVSMDIDLVTMSLQCIKCTFQRMLKSGLLLKD